MEVTLRETPYEWVWHGMRGLLAIGFALAAILVPRSALMGFTLVFASYAFVDGVIAFASGLRGSDTHLVAGFVRASIGIVVGIIFLINPLLTTTAYAAAALGIVAAWATCTGIADLWSGAKLRGVVTSASIIQLCGAVTVLVGLAVPVTLWINPFATLLSVSWMLGFYGFAVGGLLIIRAVEGCARERQTRPTRDGSASIRRLARQTGDLDRRTQPHASRLSE